MKFNMNINLSIEADNMKHAQDLANQFMYIPPFASGSAKITGMNLNEDYVGLPCPSPIASVPLLDEGADPEADGDDIPL